MEKLIWNLFKETGDINGNTGENQPDNNYSRSPDYLDFDDVD